jgi:two-component system phosphate regulon sensor histidine kinase PhoR
MAMHDSSPAYFFSPWPDRLRHSAIILLAAALALTVLVVFGDLAPPAPRRFLFICIRRGCAGAARLHGAVASGKMSAR